MSQERYLFQGKNVSVLDGNELYGSIHADMIPFLSPEAGHQVRPFITIPFGKLRPQSGQMEIGSAILKVKLARAKAVGQLKAGDKTARVYFSANTKQFSRV